MNDLSVRERIDVAFATLNDTGYCARANFRCCQSCGFAAIMDEDPCAAGVVFYHAQDAEAFDRWGNLATDDRVYLSYDSLLDIPDAQAQFGRVVAQVLRDAGLKVEWDGRPSTRIAVVGRA